MKHDWEIDLSDCLQGRKVAHVFGYVVNEFGDPAFKLTRFELDDGTSLHIEGEHDFPYIEDSNSLSLLLDRVVE